MPISKETATDIAMAWREIAAAESLLEEVEKEHARHSKEHDVRDVFGRRVDGLQLGVPSGQSSHRLFNVPWSMCRPIIETHIQAQMAIIKVLSEKAAIEASS